MSLYVFLTVLSTPAFAGKFLVLFQASWFEKRTSFDADFDVYVLTCCAERTDAPDRVASHALAALASLLQLPALHDAVVSNTNTPLYPMILDALSTYVKGAGHTSLLDSRWAHVLLHVCASCDDVCVCVASALHCMFSVCSL